MKKYTVTGNYMIGFTMEVIAESESEAEDIAYSTAESNICTEWNGNSVFVDECYGDEIEEFTLVADGYPSDITITDETDYDDEDEEDYDDNDNDEDEEDYSPNNPWDAPGMSIHDFIDFPVRP